MSDFTEQELISKLRKDFEAEAEEQVSSLINNIVELELTLDEARRSSLVENIFRNLHNLKGSARAVHNKPVEQLCHPLESVMAELKRARVQPSAAQVDLILQAVTRLRDLIACADATFTAKDKQLIQQIQQPNLITTRTAHDSPEQFTGGAMELPETPGKRAATVQETLRVSTEKLDSIMSKAEEMLAVKAMAREQDAELRELKELFDSWTSRMVSISESNARTATGTNKQKSPINRNAGYTVQSDEEFASSIQKRLHIIAGRATKVTRATESAVDILLEETKRLLMIPAASLFEGLPLMCRDLARQLGKQVEFSTSGSDIELDKRIVDALRDPVNHLIRNVIDHGLESPAERTAQGKPARGRATVSLVQLDGRLVKLIIEDDGRGIDRDRVLQTAVKKGLVSSDEAARLTKDEVIRLIFKSSFSTREEVTDISGRGIGMSIVEETINELGGRIAIDTKPGEFTRFSITLPVTMATYRGVLVAVAGKTFVIPTSAVERAIRISRTEIRSVEGTDTVIDAGKLIPICSLASVLKLPVEKASRNLPPNQLLNIIILQKQSAKFGFVVDEVLEEQEFLAKGLGRVLNGIPNVSGLTILGSGKVVPILNAGDLVRSWQSPNGSSAPQPVVKA